MELSCISFLIDFLGYALIQIPDLFVYLFGTLKRHWRDNDLLKSKPTGEPHSNTIEKENSVRGWMLSTKGYCNELNTRSVANDSNNINRDTLAENTIAKYCKNLHVEVEKILSQICECNEKLGSIKVAISEMEKKVEPQR